MKNNEIIREFLKEEFNKLLGEDFIFNNEIKRNYLKQLFSNLEEENNLNESKISIEISLKVLKDREFSLRESIETTKNLLQKHFSFPDSIIEYATQLKILQSNLSLIECIKSDLRKLNIENQRSS